ILAQELHQLRETIDSSQQEVAALSETLREEERNFEAKKAAALAQYTSRREELETSRTQNEAQYAKVLEALQEVEATIAVTESNKKSAETQIENLQLELDRSEAELAELT